MQEQKHKQDLIDAWGGSVQRSAPKACEYSGASSPSKSQEVAVWVMRRYSVKLWHVCRMQVSVVTKVVQREGVTSYALRSLHAVMLYMHSVVIVFHFLFEGLVFPRSRKKEFCLSVGPSVIKTN